MSRLDWAKPLATILGHRNAWFPVNNRGRCTTPSCSHVHWNECNAWRTSNLQETIWELKLQLQTLSKSNHYNFKTLPTSKGRASIVVFGVKSKCTPPPTSPQQVIHLQPRQNLYRKPRSKQGPPPTLKVAKTSKHITIYYKKFALASLMLHRNVLKW